MRPPCRRWAFERSKTSCGCWILATANGRQQALRRCRRRRAAAAAAGSGRWAASSRHFDNIQSQPPPRAVAAAVAASFSSNARHFKSPAEAEVAGDAERGGGAARCGQALAAPPPRRQGGRSLCRGAGRILPSRQRPQASGYPGPAGEGRGERGRRRDAGGRHSPAPPLPSPPTPRVVTPPAAPKCAAQCGRGVSTRRTRRRRPWRLRYRPGKQARRLRRPGRCSILPPPQQPHLALNSPRPRARWRGRGHRVSVDGARRRVGGGDGGAAAPATR
jgi:hypothetical protein